MEKFSKWTGYGLICATSTGILLSRVVSLLTTHNYYIAFNYR